MANEPCGLGSTASTMPPMKACAVEVHQNKSAHFGFPFREILYQTIRNTFFHVPMWFCMLFLLIFSFVSSINYLSKGEQKYDVYASAGVVAALLFGVLGLLTGMMWATYTWGEPWPNDPKLNGAAVGVLIYFAYIVLRGSITDEIKRARIAAVYNVFAVVIFILFIFIIPRITDSLHPGNGGNPAFSKYDLDSTLRMFFYPAVIGWSLLGFWITTILIRIKFLTLKDEQ
jgi:heme exporter protein C